MRHQRQGLRRLVALPVALLAALVIAPSISAASPNTVGATVLDITSCQAVISVSWAGQPGKLRSFTVELSSNVSSSVTTVIAGAMTRSGGFVTDPILLSTSADSNQFLAVTRVFDGKGIEQDSWASRPVPAPCV